MNIIDLWAYRSIIVSICYFYRANFAHISRIYNFNINCRAIKANKYEIIRITTPMKIIVFRRNIIWWRNQNFIRIIWASTKSLHIYSWSIKFWIRHNNTLSGCNWLKIFIVNSTATILINNSSLHTMSSCQISTSW